ncbi:MAG: hypothetical protein ACHQJ4_05905 [Ignavibacteria bacterium]
MKRLSIFFILAFIVYSGNNLYAGDFKLLIKYLDGEHSKDSWSKESTITVDERDYSYSMQGSGHVKPQSEDKNGTFSIDQYRKIRTYIADNNLLKNDSLFDESTKYKAFERFTNTEIKIFVDTNVYTIRYNGDIENLKDSALYRNSMGLINLVMDFIKNE